HHDDRRVVDERARRRDEDQEDDDDAPMLSARQIGEPERHPFEGARPDEPARQDEHGRDRDRRLVREARESGVRAEEPGERERQDEKKRDQLGREPLAHVERHRRRKHDDEEERIGKPRHGKSRLPNHRFVPPPAGPRATESSRQLGGRSLALPIEARARGFQERLAKTVSLLGLAWRTCRPRAKKSASSFPRSSVAKTRRREVSTPRRARRGKRSRRPDAPGSQLDGSSRISITRPPETTSWFACAARYPGALTFTRWIPGPRRVNSNSPRSSAVAVRVALLRISPSRWNHDRYTFA